MRPVLLSSLVPLCLSALLAGCTNFPEFDGAQSPGVASAPWPDLVPLSELLTAPAPPRAAPESAETVAARAEALRRRAGGLQRDVVDGSARARMQRGVPAITAADTPAADDPATATDTTAPATE